MNASPPPIPTLPSPTHLAGPLPVTLLGPRERRPKEGLLTTACRAQRETVYARDRWGAETRGEWGGRGETGEGPRRGLGKMNVRTF